MLRGLLGKPKVTFMEKLLLDTGMTSKPTSALSEGLVSTSIMKTALWFHNLAIKVCLGLYLGKQIEKLVLSQNSGIRKQTIYWFQT